MSKLIKLGRFTAKALKTTKKSPSKVKEVLKKSKSEFMAGFNSVEK